MGYERKYAGPLQPGIRSAYVKGARKNCTPRALNEKKKSKKAKKYTLSKPLENVLDKKYAQKGKMHWETVTIKQQNIPPIPRYVANQPYGIQMIMPVITQVGQPIVGGGVETANITSRRGNDLHLKHMNVHLLLRLNPAFYANNANGVWYKVMVMTCKKEPIFNEFVPQYFQGGAQVALQNFILRDGKDATPMNAEISDISDPVNTELFTVHASKQGFLTKGQLLNPGQADEVFAQSVMKQLTLKVNCKSKVLKYNQPVESLPTNFQPFIIFFWKDLNSFNYNATQPIPDYVEASGKVHIGWDY